MNTYVERSSKLIAYTKKQLFLTGMIVLFVTQLSFLLGSPTVNAAINDNPAKQALNWALLNGIQKCMDTEGQRDANGVLNITDALKESNAKAGNWYGDDAKRSSSYMFNGEKNNEGKASCNSMVKQATSEWGFNSPLDLLCSFVLKRDNGSSCANGSGDFGYFGDLNERFREKIIEKVWSGKDPTPGGAGYYLIFRTAFAGACAPKKNPNASGDFKYDVVQVYNAEDGPYKKDVIYEGKKRSTKTLVYTSDNLNEVERDCAYIVDKMEEHSQSFLNYLRTASTDERAAVAGAEDETISKSSDSDTSCDVDGIGWLVCPMLTFMGGLNDAAFTFLTKFLVIEPRLLTDPDTRAAWSTFRDIANVAFVIAFLMIIYSQISGAGVSNYGIKKLIPRVIVAAILVNLSYVFCQLAVDISNIVGSSVYQFFKDVPTGATSSSDLSNGTSWATTIGYILAVGAAALAALLLASTLGIAALLAFMLVIFILVARKALLILLVVISPLAFVAYLLPNTESWFKKWWKLFSGLLMVFPVVGVVFGASTLAARVINNAGGAPDDSNIMTQLTALGVLAVPLFAVPTILKGALAAAGGIGQKLSGYQDKAMGAAGKKSKGRMKDSRLGEAKSAMDRRKAVRKINRRVGDGRLGSINKRIDRSRLGKYIGGDKAANRATEADQKITGEEIGASVAQLDKGPVGEQITRAKAQLLHANTTGDEIAARAATQVLATKTGSKGIEQLHSTINQMEAEGGPGVHESIRDGVKYDINNAGLKGKDRSLDEYSRSSDKNLEHFDNHEGTARGLTEPELAGQTEEQLSKYVDSGSVTKEQASAVLRSNENGTVGLTAKKKLILERAANSQRNSTASQGDVDEASAYNQLNTSPNNDQTHQEAIDINLRRP